MITPEWEFKCWGRVLHVFVSPHAAVSCLEVDRGLRCSWHIHWQRSNMFVVQEGIVVIEHVDGDDHKFHEHNRVLRMLSTGGVVTIPAGVWHRFRVLEGGKMTEVYFPTHPGLLVELNDIDRRDSGGPDDVKELESELKKAGLF